jgi:hypothetical protein
MRLTREKIIADLKSKDAAIPNNETLDRLVKDLNRFRRYEIAGLVMLAAGILFGIYQVWDIWSDPLTISLIVRKFWAPYILAQLGIIYYHYPRKK